MISVLEAAAVLFALQAFEGHAQTEHGSTLQVMPTWTDNSRTGSALNKLMTTRHPAHAVLMEVSAFHESQGYEGRGGMGVEVD